MKKGGRTGQGGVRVVFFKQKTAYGIYYAHEGSGMRIRYRPTYIHTYMHTYLHA